jgi:hypothetical protein
METNEMNIQDLIAKYQSAVRNHTVGNLKADVDFMKACRKNEDFRDYVLSVRPDMASCKQHVTKFKRPAGIVADMPQEPESPLTAKPEALMSETEEPISKTGQVLKDLLGYKKKKGFL